MSMTSASIPTLSIRELPFSKFAAALGRSFRDHGFAIVADHGIDSSLLGEAWSLSKGFFDLPEAVKLHYYRHSGAGQRGYTPFGREVAKGASVHDLKEFWHIGREPGPGKPLPASMPPNIWPVELPNFRSCFTLLFAEFDRLGARLLDAIALDLGLESGWFAAPTDQGNSILRLLHYPPVEGSEAAMAGAVRAGAHEDINLITLLLGAEEAGLQLLDRAGRWQDISPPEGALVVNIGDMLQRLTNHVLPSTTHRVINPSEDRRTVSRYSMPFFLHLRPDFLIDALPGCVSGSNPRRYAPITAEDYLKERLREIGLLSSGAK